MTFEAVFTNILYGLTIASALLLIASGLSLIFGIVGVVNFAHGSFGMLGAYVSYSLVGATGSFWGALMLAPLVITAGAVLIERLTLRPLYGLNPLYQLFLTFALSLVFSNLVLWIWGGDTLSIATPSQPSSAMRRQSLSEWRPSAIACRITSGGTRGA